MKLLVRRDPLSCASALSHTLHTERARVEQESAILSTTAIDLASLACLFTGTEATHFCPAFPLPGLKASRTHPSRLCAFLQQSGCAACVVCVLFPCDTRCMLLTVMCRRGVDGDLLHESPLPRMANGRDIQKPSALHKPSATLQNP